MAVDFAIRLYEEIQTGTIACNFQGISLGDSWISPVDSVQTWPQYLKSFVSNIKHSETKLKY